MFFLLNPYPPMTPNKALSRLSTHSKDYQPSHPPDKSLFTHTGQRTLLPPPPDKSSPFFCPHSTHHYSHQEYHELCSKDLCFHCKLPYSPLHECPDKSLRALIAVEDESFSLDDKIDNIETKVSPISSPCIDKV